MGASGSCTVEQRAKRVPRPDRHRPAVGGHDVLSAAKAALPLAPPWHGRGENPEIATRGGPARPALQFPGGHCLRPRNANALPVSRPALKLTVCLQGRLLFTAAAGSLVDNVLSARSAATAAAPSTVARKRRCRSAGWHPGCRQTRAAARADPVGAAGP